MEITTEGLATKVREKLGNELCEEEIAEVLYATVGVLSLMANDDENRMVPSNPPKPPTAMLLTSSLDQPSAKTGILHWSASYEPGARHRILHTTLTVTIG